MEKTNIFHYLLDVNRDVNGQSENLRASYLHMYFFLLFSAKNIEEESLDHLGVSSEQQDDE